MRVETHNIEIKDDDNVINVTLPPSQNGWTVVVAPTQILVFQTHSSDPPTLLCLSTRVDANAPSTTSSPPLICTRAHVDVPSNGVAPISDADSLTKADVPTKATAKLTARTTGGGAPGTQDISTTTARVDPTIDVTAGMDALDLGGYVSESSQVPSHLRDCVPDERFRVSKELQAQYPPMTDIGWKELSWVVVIRGREVGVFHDFWARIWPLIKFDKKAVIPGAFWRKAQGENDALGIWASAYKKGAVNRIR